MSQIGRAVLGSGGAVVETLTADTGTNPVGPDGAFNINVFGGANATAPSAVNIVTVGDAGANTLKVNLKDSINLPNSSVTGTYVLALNSVSFLHNYGLANTFLGSSAGNFTLLAHAINNTAIGSNAGNALVGTALGQGTSNTLFGNESGQFLTEGSYNTFLGDSSGSALVDGQNNICIGFAGGGALTTNDSNNIIIGNVGVAGDNQRIRIGSTQTSNFQSGIYGVTPAGTLDTVIIDNNGQLGTAGGTIATRYNEDSGFAVPAAGILEIKGGTSTGGVATNINTRGSGNLVEVNLNNNINLPNTDTAGTTGVYLLQSARFMHNYTNGVTKTNAFLGRNAGNFTTTGTGNTGLGNSVLTSVTIGSSNTCAGSAAGSSLTEGVGNCIYGTGSGAALVDGDSNTAVGTGALDSLVSADNNTCIGFNAGAAILTERNTALGSNASATRTGGTGNIAIGYLADGGVGAKTGSNNVLIGFEAGQVLTSGDSNTCIGYNIAPQLTTGASNILIGPITGGDVLSTGDSNIHIGTGTSTAGESDTIRLGSLSQQTRCFVAGIAGTTLATPVGSVLVDANGQLGQGPAAGIFQWNSVAGTSQSAVVGNGYICLNAGLTTVTLPGTFAVGDVIAVVGTGAAFFRLAAAAGDTISFTADTTSGGGSLTATEQYDSIEVIGVVANSQWVVRHATGNYTVA